MTTIRDKAATSARVTGYFSLTLGIIFSVVAIGPLRDGLWHMALFILPAALVFIATGIAFLRIAKRKERNQNGA